MEENRDAFLTKEIGRSMRFFLNVSCLFIVILFLFSIPQPLTPESLMIALIPVIVAVLFFLAFLRLLKNIEGEAAKHRDIELTTRVIGEFNKSWIIRAAIGRIPAFKIEKKPE
ncbi:MAG: hypothetical protein ACHQ2F_12980 [Desulfobaccales bacterium]